MLGKQKCKILKEIRQRIADENDIPWVTQECTHKGNCRGTCPKCESELRELERQLAARQALGKRVAVAALCTGLAFSSAGCAPLDMIAGSDGDPLPMRHTPAPAETPDPSEWQIVGEVPYDGPLEGEPELMGDVEMIDFPEDGDTLMGEAVEDGSGNG